jgi:uncharacterized membrane protein
MRSNFTIGGHPIHAALVALPIGLFAWAFTADIVYLATDKDETWYDIAYWSGIAGVVTALLAALPGFGDFLTMASKSNARGIALTHMLLNLATVGCFATAAALMYDHNATDGGALTAVIALHALGTGMLLLSGYLGGHMVYNYHLGMVPDDGEQEQAEHRHHDRVTVRGRPEYRSR